MYAIEARGELIELQAKWDLLIEESMGEITPEIEAIEQAMLACHETMAERLDFLVWKSRKLKDESEALRKHAAKLTERARVREAALDRRKIEALSLFRTMSKPDSNGKRKPVKLDSVTVYSQVTKSVDCDVPAEVLPEQYRRVKVEPYLSKLKEALLQGEQVSGVRLVEREGVRFR